MSAQAALTRVYGLIDKYGKYDTDSEPGFQVDQETLLEELVTLRNELEDECGCSD